MTDRDELTDQIEALCTMIEDEILWLQRRGDTDALRRADTLKDVLADAAKLRPKS